MEHGCGSSNGRKRANGEHFPFNKDGMTAAPSSPVDLTKCRTLTLHLKPHVQHLKARHAAENNCENVTVQLKVDGKRRAGKGKGWNRVAGVMTRSLKTTRRVAA